MTQVLVPIADGSEEMEAVITIDVLRRAGAEVTVASVMGKKTVTASRKVVIQADTGIEDCTAQSWDLIALPGGLPGAEHLSENSPLLSLVKQQMEQEKWLAAICAAPAVVLGRNNLLQGYTATCHPGFQSELADYARVSEDRVVKDRHLITSQAPGTAIEFALTLVECLFGPEKREEVAGPMVV